MGQCGPHHMKHNYSLYRAFKLQLCSLYMRLNYWSN